MRRFHPIFFIGCLVINIGLLIAFVLVSVSASIVAAQEIPDRHDDYCAEYDDLAPVIELKGEDNINFVANSKEYVDEGVNIVDYCNTELETISNVDSKTPGQYRVKYIAKDQMGNETVLRRYVRVIPEWNGTIYLTFDDGPGIYTDALLDVLARYNVKATFFVTGAGDDATILREYQEGHAIALHTWSHDYSYVYSSVDNYFADLSMISERVKRITGEETKMIRFPGGSSNTVSTRYDGGSHIMSTLAREVERRGYTYFDWNISSGDAGGANNTNEVYSRVVNNLFEGGSSVVLQHDVKGFSVDAVASIIEYGLSHGYVFEKLTPSSFTAHHGINN